LQGSPEECGAGRGEDMTSNPKSNLPDEMFEDGGLAEGVQRAANALCENDDISDALKDQLRSNLLFSAMGKDYYFSEAQAEKVLQRLMDAVLELATSTDGAGGAQDDTEGKEAAAADGGAADPKPFLGTKTLSLSRSEPAGREVPNMAFGLKSTTRGVIDYQDSGVPKGNRKARRARK